MTGSVPPTADAGNRHTDRVKVALLSDTHAPRFWRGNNDGPDIVEWGAPDTLEIELAGVRVAMVHDSGPAAGRGARLRRWFPAADLVVFGHSHIPWDETFDGQRAVNPGSPTDRRRQPAGTMGLLDLADGQIASVRIVAVTAARPTR
jgi:predicted phosphodiesterase